MSLSRRDLILSAAGLPLSIAATTAWPATAPKAERLRAAEAQLAALERDNGGRLGVAVVDTASGARLSHRAGERFAMCSTFKVLAAAAVLKTVDDGHATLDATISYGPGDLLGYAPVTRQHVGERHMSLGDLCAAAIEWSDNTAANLLLRQVGGPHAVTGYARTLGDTMTRLDRTEPTLNTAIPGDPRDTTTPDAMVADLTSLLLGGALSTSSRRQLAAWMIACKTGVKRLRAGLPPDWRVGDKTGSGDHATANTVAILWPPGRAPLIAAVYYTQSPASPDARDAVHADVARLIADTF